MLSVGKERLDILDFWCIIISAGKGIRERYDF